MGLPAGGAASRRVGQSPAAAVAASSARDAKKRGNADDGGGGDDDGELRAKNGVQRSIYSISRLTQMARVSRRGKFSFQPDRIGSYFSLTDEIEV